MGAPEWAIVGVAIMSIIFGVIGYLLSQKDAAQALEISKLTDYKDKQSEKIHELEVEVIRRVHQDEWKEIMGKIFEIAESSEVREIWKWKGCYGSSDYSSSQIDMFIDSSNLYVQRINEIRGTIKPLE